MHEGQAERTEQMRAAQTEAKLEVVLRLIQVIGSSTLADEAAQIALALRFIDSLGDMVGDSGAQWPVPASMEETLDRLRGSIVVDPGHTRQR
jgi:hypothetical protein